MKTYAVRPHLFHLHDRPHDPEPVLFHVRSGDYFATLATLLTLINELSPLEAHSRQVLEHARQDLLYLQSTHAIVPKFEHDERFYD